MPTAIARLEPKGDRTKRLAIDTRDHRPGVHKARRFLLAPPRAFALVAGGRVGMRRRASRARHSQRLIPVVRDQLRAPFDSDLGRAAHVHRQGDLERLRHLRPRVLPRSALLHDAPIPPLYHALVAVLPQDPGNAFFTGRLVAACFMAARRRDAHRRRARAATGRRRPWPSACSSWCTR